MVKGLYTAYTGMVEEQRRLDVLTNNLANANTTGYKKEGATNASFAEKLALRIKDTAHPNLAAGMGYIKMGVKVGETYTNYEQGGFRVTDEPSDLAIGGEGFFAIEYTDKQGNTSIKYTRDGAFTVDNEGYFRTSDGDYLLNMGAALAGRTGDNAHVRVDPMLDYQVDSQGNIWQEGVNIGQVGVVDIDNYDYILKYGENLYDIQEGGNVVATNDMLLEQGALETSNVNIVDEMVSMITIQRAFEAGQKMIQAEDETIEMAVSQVGRV
ncbi:MAG: flagellar hook-basal body protein [Lachnospiraceae bacterium]|nr:flagellar hook-basal body protein [Lachnospiraceae bacterium]